MSSRSSKRQRLSKPGANNGSNGDSDLEEISVTEWNSTAQDIISKTRTEGLSGMSRSSISPPPARNAAKNFSVHKPVENIKAAGGPSNRAVGSLSRANDNQRPSARHLVPSPIQLSTVNGYPSLSNIDTVSLSDILGNPLIRECWLFNYLFDVDFVMYMLSLRLRVLLD